VECSVVKGALGLGGGEDLDLSEGVIFRFSGTLGLRGGVWEFDCVVMRGFTGDLPVGVRHLSHFPG
jgi:hypothetical protein